MPRAFSFWLILLLPLGCGPAAKPPDEEIPPARAALDRGCSYYAKGERDKAIAAFTTAIKLDPALPQPYRSRGVAYSSKGEYQLAIADFTKAIRLDPNYDQAYCNRATAYFEMHDYDRAIADFSSFLKFDPLYATAYYNRGLSYLRKGDFDRALLDHAEAIRLAPENPMNYVGRGNAYDCQGNYDAAIEDYNRALLIKPINPRIYGNRASTYLAKGDYEHAASDCVSVIDLVHDDAVVTYAQTWLFLSREHLGQDGKAALAEFRKSLRDDRWITNVVRMFLNEITPDACLAAAIDKDPQRDKEKKCEVHFYIGQFHLLKGDTASARKSFQSCLDTGVIYFTEYASSLAELKRLAQPPKK